MTKRSGKSLVDDGKLSALWTPTKETSPKRPLAKVAFALVFLALLLNLVNDVYQRYINQEPRGPKQVLANETQQETKGLPVRLKIPVIDVDAAIEYLGLTAKGAMEVPNTTANVGWYYLGPRPGETGSAVMDGHLNGQSNEAGVFVNLHKLKKDDKVYVEDDQGESLVFVVREIRNYDAGHAEEVFTSSREPRLNLITCSGVWDAGKESYTKRLVVFTELQQD